MKFILERSALLGAMTRLAAIVQKKQPIPILANVLIEAGAGVIRLRASNLDMEAIELVSCDMLSTPGITTAPAQTLLDIARNAPDGAQISFELDGRLIVKFGRSRFQLATLSADSFPQLMVDEFDGEFEIAADDLHDIMTRSSFAIENDVSRSFLGGVRLHGEGDTLKSCSTNGKVMIVISNPLPAGADGISVTVPSMMAAQLARLLSGETQNIKVSYSPRKVSFSWGVTTITSKVIDEAYPRFPLAESQPIIARTDRDGLMQMVRRVAVLSDQNRGVRLTWGDGGVSASTRTANDEGVDEIAADYDGPELVVGFSTAYLLGMLANLNGDIVEFQFSEGLVGAQIIKAPSDPDTLINAGTIKI